MNRTNLDERQQLPALLGLWDAIAFVIGSIIGSGVFLKASTIAEELPYIGPIIVIWIVVGLVTLCGSLALAELAAMMPHAGGPYIYLRDSFGQFPAFLWGWAEFWVVRTGSIGALASATVMYLNSVVRIPDDLHGLTAVGLIVLLTIVNWRSTRWGTSVQNATTLIKLGLLLMLIALPLLLRRIDTANLNPAWPSTLSSDLWLSMGIAAVSVMWAYDGWINIGPVAEEIRSPQRNIPLALVCGLAIIIVVYVGANAVYHLTLPLEQVIATKTVASDVAALCLGGIGVPLVAIGVMCSTFGATQSNLITGPRIYFAMARDGVLPQSLSTVHVRYATPANAVLVQGLWACVLVLAASRRSSDPDEAFNFLTVFVIFGGAIFYSLAVASVFVFRRKQPGRFRPYRTWGYPWTPAICLFGYGLAIVSMILEKWQESASVGILVLAGVVFYLWRMRGSTRASEWDA